MSPEPYEIIPWQPETKESMKARWNKALAQIPMPPTRPHVFDFDCNVRMIVSIESAPALGTYTHLSFGCPPWNMTLHSDSDLQKTAYQLAAEFMGLKEPTEKVQTIKAFHLFYKNA